MNIILIGPPASGKGTQAKLLAEKFDLYHISTGELFREISKQQTALSQKISEFLKRGDLVPDELTIELVTNKIRQIDGKNGVLFDGFPRTVFQAKALDGLICIDYIFEIDVSKQELLKRAESRLVCQKCGKGYVTYQNASFCSDCGGKLVKRVDDAKEIVEQRYDDYFKSTYPIISYYKNHQGYHKIDGQREKKQVFLDICSNIKV